MHQAQREAAMEALMMFKRDRRREIDAVIDYFGGSRDTRALRSREAPETSNRFAYAAANEALGFPEG